MKYGRIRGKVEVRLRRGFWGDWEEVEEGLEEDWGAEERSYERGNFYKNKKSTDKDIEQL